MTYALLSADFETTRDSRVRRRGRPRRNEDVGPTPETVNKLEPDALLMLLENKLITQEQDAAARELNTMWRALSRGMLPQQKIGVSMPAPGRRRARSPFARMHDAEVLIWTRRYKPWAAAESLEEVCRAPRLSRLDLTRRIVEGNQRYEDIARMFCIARSRVLEELRQSLDLYCAFKRAKKQLT